MRKPLSFLRKPLRHGMVIRTLCLSIPFEKRVSGFEPFHQSFHHGEHGFGVGTAKQIPIFFPIFAFINSTGIFQVIFNGMKSCNFSPFYHFCRYQQPGPWQIEAISLPASSCLRTKSTISLSRRHKSGAYPPGTTTASKI